ncbi:copper chaperone PCu(A)C [Sphingomonas bacterium]|uniref:copper chaperone PCu(A)C n=1 Tax=Sphingomonas bacterium TaxID=1895847 RepID=UPI0020C6FB4A|nr:copper chaperone PCu(A)C [Sphingomonas bacterium]
MNRRRPLSAIAVLLAASLATAGCSKPKQLYVDRAWVRLPGVAHQPAAVYFTVHGGPVATTLIDVSSDVAIRSEMHETMTSAGTSAGTGTGTGTAGGGRPGTAAMTRMTPLQTVAIPAASLDAFAPGGRHVMLFGLARSVKRGGTMALTFTFGDGERILQTASVLGAGDPPPGD